MTKIHAVVDAEGHPVRIKLTEGQAHDGRSAADMIETIGPGDIFIAGRATRKLNLAGGPVPGWR